MLETLRTGGSSARIAPDASVNEDQTQHFERFRTRLESGELVSGPSNYVILHSKTFPLTNDLFVQFVAMAGVEVLAFCSSQHTLMSQKLNVPPMLLGLPNTVLVSRVVIEDYSAYADAAIHADSVRW